ncbi:hypothetical protein [Mannheimia massilioguelmaensis]|uniref:hypothetical protein n=1 Tax=Mannheimia massilioguelmaensis TaxID=1604354 RepID=UPI0012E090B0|nr:hypothetical protein [Mannheimia massilioguelmaensis]
MKYNNPSEYQEYSEYLDYAEPLISKCYFDLGYRFRAPYYWCVAENNMETCKVNQKYR